MSGHHPWQKLLAETYTPEQQEAIRAESKRMLEEHRRRRMWLRARGRNRGPIGPAKGGQGISKSPAT